MWPEKKLGKLASVSRPRSNAPKKSQAVSVTERSQAQKLPTKPCMNTLIKPSPSALASARWLASWLPVDARAIPIDFLKEEPVGNVRELATTAKHFARGLTRNL